MRDDDFRLFSNGACEWGSWDDDSCREPHERSGACAYFDAWPVCGAMQFRVWHIKKDLNIELKGEGYKIKKRECVYHPNEYEGEDLSTYCTTFVFNITQPKGQIEVSIPSETMWDDNSLIKWEDGFIYDLDHRKAHLEIKAFDHYEIKEILTDIQRQKFALSDRVYKLKNIARKMNRSDILWQIDMAQIQGDFDIIQSRYEKYLL